MEPKCFFSQHIPDGLSKEIHTLMLSILRSQFAMNFLDPSFIPLTNALNEELQGKPSKWKFNRTAFYLQR